MGSKNRKGRTVVSSPAEISAAGTREYFVTVIHYEGEAESDEEIENVTCTDTGGKFANEAVAEAGGGDEGYKGRGPS